MTYNKFVIISHLRSGTHLLRTALESHPAIVCQTEVFNSDNPKLPYPLSTPTEQVLSDWVFKAFPENVEDVGFVLQVYHPHKLKAFPGIRDNPNWFDIWQILADMPDLRVIHLRRKNLLRRHLSHVQARKTGQWHQWDKQRVQQVTHLEDSVSVEDTVRRDTAVALDAKQLEMDFEEVEYWHRRADDLLGHHPKLSITYEELCRNFDSVSDTILDFLNVPSLKLKAAVKKLEQRPLHEAITNYSELKRYFSDKPWARFFE